VGVNLSSEAAAGSLLLLSRCEERVVLWETPSAEEHAMSTQTRIQIRDWFHTLLSRLGMRSEYVLPTQKPDAQGKANSEKPPYQNPGKDKNHPGDDAAVQASTEPREGQAAKR
jgi:hypothetical protein